MTITLKDAEEIVDKMNEIIERINKIGQEVSKLSKSHDGFGISFNDIDELRKAFMGFYLSRFKGLPTQLH